MTDELNVNELDQVSGGKYYLSQHGTVRIVHCGQGMFALKQPGGKERVGFVGAGSEHPYFGSCDGWAKIKVHGQYGYVKAYAVAVVD